jgi:hypothetical protein
MDDRRKTQLRRSLERELEAHASETQCDPRGRALWLCVQLDNYVERWLAFCAMPGIPMVSLLNDDLFAMIGCGAVAFEDTIRLLPDDHELPARWARFSAVLADVQATKDRVRAGELRGALAELQTHLAGEL